MASKKRPFSQVLVVKEGFLNKKRGILKGWNKRYFMLNKQSLVYFRREQESEFSAMGRIFLSDIVSIDKAKDEIECRKFCLYTKKRVIFLQASSTAERESWLGAIRSALESEGEAEKKDPFRRTLRRLAPGLKRVTLMKDPEKGIGCTIKNAAGHIFVNRIVEDGPIALTGVLRPGLERCFMSGFFPSKARMINPYCTDDELLDVNGVTITGMTIAEVGQVIRNCPEEFLATVRPITALRKHPPSDGTRVNYVTVLPNLSSSKASARNPATSLIKDRAEFSPCDSLDDDDDDEEEEEEEEEGTPPPIPVKTEGAFHLINQLSPNIQQDSKEKIRSHSISFGDTHSELKERPKKRVHVYEDIRTTHADVLITDDRTLK